MEKKEEYSYFCKMCRAPLFKEEALEIHKNEPKKLRGVRTEVKTTTCTSYFVSQQSWMSLKDSSNTGKLHCPNAKVSIEVIVV